jgi:tRNA (guanine-N7-)-methyltransferase
VGKNKLARWTELGTYSNVIQPEIGDINVRDHLLKGRWNELLFRNENPVTLELGCGKGEYTVGLAARFPYRNFIGIDIKGARMWRGAKTANDLQLPNVAFLRTRIEFINSFFSADEVDEIWITFPDPHPGGKNANKRLTSPGFLASYSMFLKNNGLIHLKTDNKELYEFTRKTVTRSGMEIISDTTDLHSEILQDDIQAIRTHYEAGFINKGYAINYLSFRLDKGKINQDARHKNQTR